ncbi:MAG: SDR family oxidoreductase [Verrucomicrobiae bacterium]|nr:SDR family oxidoreductase [Verrucomicrobiae bacterium]
MPSNGIFDLNGRVVVVTGATGVLAGSAADYLAGQGARVAYLGRSPDKVEAACARARAAHPQSECLGVVADVLDHPSLECARDQVLETWGTIDGLLNGAGGNMPGATIQPGSTLADLDFDSYRQVVDLNLHGTVLPSVVFSSAMSSGASIVNYSSVSVPAAETRVIGYSAAKAGVENLTRWLAVHMAGQNDHTVRVNALMPGFFLADQNRRLLLNEDGSLIERGRKIIDRTPFGRLGEANELHGAVHYLLAEASSFVTGTVLTVDGGFMAFSGV